MKPAPDNFFKNVQSEVCVLLKMKTVLEKLKDTHTFDKIKHTFSHVLGVNLGAYLAEHSLSGPQAPLSHREARAAKFGINSKTFVFKENLKFICMYISRDPAASKAQSTESGRSKSRSRVCSNASATRIARTPARPRSRRPRPGKTSRMPRPSTGRSSANRRIGARSGGGRSRTKRTRHGSRGPGATNRASKMRSGRARRRAANWRRREGNPRPKTRRRRASS